MNKEASPKLWKNSCFGPSSTITSNIIKSSSRLYLNSGSALAPSSMPQIKRTPRKYWAPNSVDQDCRSFRSTALVATLQFHSTSFAFLVNAAGHPCVSVSGLRSRTDSINIIFMNHHLIASFAGLKLSERGCKGFIASQNDCIIVYHKWWKVTYLWSSKLLMVYQKSMILGYTSEERKQTNNWIELNCVVFLLRRFSKYYFTRNGRFTPQKYTILKDMFWLEAFLEIFHRVADWKKIVSKNDFS